MKKKESKKETAQFAGIILLHPHPPDDKPTITHEWHA